jgi:hypothetical protein
MLRAYYVSSVTTIAFRGSFLWYWGSRYAFRALKYLCNLINWKWKWAHALPRPKTWVFIFNFKITESGIRRRVATKKKKGIWNSTSSTEFHSLFFCFVASIAPAAEYVFDILRIPDSYASRHYVHMCRIRLRHSHIRAQPLNTSGDILWRSRSVACLPFLSFATRSVRTRLNTSDDIVASARVRIRLRHSLRIASAVGVAWKGSSFILLSSIFLSAETAHHFVHTLVAHLRLWLLVIHVSGLRSGWEPDHAI